MNVIPNTGSNKKNYIKWVAVILLLLLLTLIIWVINNFRNEKRFAVLKIYGKGNSINLTNNHNLVFFTSGKKSKGALLAEKGDVINFNDVYFQFNNVKQDSILVDDTGDSLVLINNRVNSIIVSDSENLVPWFRNMKSSDLTHLESIHFYSKIPDSYVNFLKEIARQKPNTSLIFYPDDSVDILGDYINRLNLFSPKFVTVSLNENEFIKLNTFNKAECIYIQLKDSIITKPLPGLPYLKHCILFADDIVSIDSLFFINNKQLKKVSLLSGLTDYKLLQPLNKLEELSINNDKLIVDALPLKKIFNQLTVLNAADTFLNIDWFTDLKKLRWLGLPVNTTQQQFNKITNSLYDLQVLEITGNDSITNLAPLQQMPNLSGLVITDTVTDKQTLYALNKLHYLSLPNEDSTDSAYIKDLEKALPGCIIVPNTGACLGSGWLLLLFPVVLLFSLYFHNGFIKKTAV